MAVTPREPAAEDRDGRPYVLFGLGDAAFDAIPLIEAADRGRVAVLR